MQCKFYGLILLWMDHLLKGNQKREVEIKKVLYDTLDGSRYIIMFIYLICLLQSWR